MEVSEDALAGLALGLLQESLGYRIRLVQIAAFKDFESVIKGFGLAPRYYGLLSLVETNPGLPQGKLAEAIHLVRSSLVPILDKLEAENTVQRRASDHDRRSKTVWLTPKGKRLVAKLRPLVLAHEARITRDFTETEKKTLLRLLGKVELNLRQDLISADAA